MLTLLPKGVQKNKKEASGKLIYVENLKSKFSWHCPFKLTGKTINKFSLPFFASSIFFYLLDC
jgi:hypothetical protein